MFDESELLTHFHKICWDAEVLALKNVHDIQLPLCGFLIEFTSSDCLKLMKSESDNWSNLNQPYMERILLNYLITDYISCGLSSPIFYTVFHSTLQSNKSKTKLLKHLIIFWDSLFNKYEITSLNVDFIKHFVVSLERLFLKISNADSSVTFECDKVISKMKNKIKIFDLRVLDSQILHTLCDNNIKVLNSNKKRTLSIENITESKPKVNSSNPSLFSHTKQNNKIMKNVQKGSLDLLNSHQSFNSASFNNQNLPKNSILISDDAENLPIKKTEPADKVMHPEQKLNVFQIMMLNAKKLKTKTK